jgi:hypothetical protein
MDSPDWQNIITLISGGGVTDAPDWQEVVTGPGGNPLPVAGVSPYSYYQVLGYVGLTCDPTVANNSAAKATGALSMSAFVALSTASVNFMTFFVGSPAACTANQNYLGIYDSGQAVAGQSALLGSTAAGVCDTPFNTSGLSRVQLQAPVSLVQGQMYYACILNNGGTPGFANSNLPNPNNAYINPLGLTKPVRWFPAGSTHTTLSATALWTGGTLAAGPWLVFIS